MEASQHALGPIAVFDSGMGGISVLRQLHKLMPYEHFLYMGDSKNAPYGVKSKEEVYQLSKYWMTYFMERNAKAVVIACNTATSAAASKLRTEYPDIPIIGLEPALKPAATVFAGTGKRILVMATELTLREDKFQHLLHQYENDAEIHLLAAPGLVELVEANEIDTAKMEQYLQTILAPYIEMPIDGVVLGCTHFPFAKHSIAKILGNEVVFFDGAEGAARELKRQLIKKGTLAPEDGEGSVLIENSDESGAKLELSKHLYSM